MQTLLWVLGAAALTGLGLGFFFRVPALVVASAILATIACVTSVRAGSSVASAVLLTLGYLLVLQGSYLAGLIISGGRLVGQAIRGSPYEPLYRSNGPRWGRRTRPPAPANSPGA